MAQGPNTFFHGLAGQQLANGSVSSAFERGDHHLDQGAATEIGSPIETLVSSAIVPPTKTKPLASTARCIIGVRMLRVMFMMSSCS